MKELDTLITGQSLVGTPRSTIRQTFGALHHAHTILTLLDRQGEPAAIRYLEGVRCRSRCRCSGTEALVVARHLSATVQRFLRLRSPGALCLARSLAVAAALLSIGIPVQVVIGKRQVGGRPLLESNSVQGYDFHAWVELDGRVLTDAPINKLGHVEMMRVPARPLEGITRAGG